MRKLLRDPRFLLDASGRGRQRFRQPVVVFASTFAAVRGFAADLVRRVLDAYARPEPARVLARKSRPKT